MIGSRFQIVQSKNYFFVEGARNDWHQIRKCNTLSTAGRRLPRPRTLREKNERITCSNRKIIKPVPEGGER
jgi:hypothetical protein